MAALQKIRSWGAATVILISLALFAFIAGDFFQSFQATQNEKYQRVGEIYGESINIQEYQKIVEEYISVLKFTSGQSTFTEEQMTQIRDQVWNAYVNNKIIEHEAAKLGLVVTDAEVQAIINQGTNPMLQRTPFRNEQTGLFDINVLKKFLADYENMNSQAMQMPAEYIEYYQQLFNYWTFIEKSIKEGTLAEKYQALLSKSVMSNPVSAKAAFDGRLNEAQILLASVPYSTIADSEITVENSDLKNKYNELKDLFKQPYETRDIKFIDVEVTASPADKKALDEEMDGYNKQLAETTNPAKLVRESNSIVAYSTLPVSKNALPRDIAAFIDTMKVGTQKAPYYSVADNSMNIVKLISKISAPDSIEYRQIQVAGADEAAIRKTADSILTVLKAGTPFDTIAKKFNQTGEKVWLTSSQYEGAPLDENSRKLIQTLNKQGVNAIESVDFGQASIILQVTARRAMIDKYDVAIIKRPIEFSKETYTKAYNDFSQFLAGNPTLEEIEANAMSKGYRVQTRNDVANSEHYIARVADTQEALRWVFNEDTELGEVSPLYECGNNDHLMAVILTAIHPEGYRTLEDSNVKDFLTTEVIKDKKAEKIKEQIANMKSVAEVASVKGTLTDTINHVSFGSSAFISATSSSEPAISGSVAKAEKGAFVNAIKGNGGVYAFQVLDKTQRADKFDAKKEEDQISNRASRIIMSRFVNELTEKAKIKDNRYLFF